MNPADFEEEAKCLLEGACNFQAADMVARNAACDEYRSKETSEENILRIMMDGLFVKITRRMEQKIEKSDTSISFQLAVSASYIRTHFIIADMIMNGDLIEATVLSRKQLEALARLNELDSKPLGQLLGKTPNITNALKGSSKAIYGHMSEIAHSSSHRVAELLHIFDKGELVGPSLHPVYSQHAHAACDMITFVDLFFCFWMLKKMEIWYSPASFEDEIRTLVRAAAMAAELGIIREESSPSTPKT